MFSSISNDWQSLRVISVPKTDASAATIGVDEEVIARLLRLKQLTVEVRAGRAVRSLLYGPFRSNNWGSVMMRNDRLTRQLIEKIGGASRDRTDDLIVANDGEGVRHLRFEGKAEVF